ncbi:MAG: hypothetical protein JSS07_12055 [Proteobacteria bacterium]|nr:hypothetical protein [Pseudomonadota bacterium]
MKNYFTVSLLSLAMLAGLSTESFADYSEFDSDNIMSASGTFIGGHKVESQELSPLSGYAISAAKLASTPVENVARYAAAYNTSYYGIEGLKEATALGLYGLAYVGGTFAAGPTFGSGAANAAYYGTKGLFKVLDYSMPSYNGALAAMYTPAVKLVTDKVIDYAPTILNAAYTGASSLVSGGLSALSSFGQSFSNWYNSKDETPTFPMSGSYVENLFSSSDV